MNKNKKQCFIIILVYILAIAADILHGVWSYRAFLYTYGDKSFFAGILGILICNGGHILIFLLLSIAVFLYLFKRKK